MFQSQWRRARSTEGFILLLTLTANHRFVSQTCQNLFRFYRVQVITKKLKSLHILPIINYSASQKCAWLWILVHKIRKDWRILLIISHYCPGHAGSCKEVAIFDRTGELRLIFELKRNLLITHKNVKYTHHDQTFCLQDQYPLRQKYLRTTPPPYYQIWPIICRTVYQRCCDLWLMLNFRRLSLVS